MTFKAADRVVHELTDIDTNEVSIVDRAANKRKFLTVKRDGGSMAGREVTPNGKGGFTATGANKSKTRKAAMEFPPGFKEMVTPMLDKASEMLGALQDAVKSGAAAEIGDDAELPGVPAEFVTQAQNIITMLDKASNMFPTASPEIDPEDDPSLGGDGGADEATEPTEMQMRATLENTAKTFGVFGEGDDHFQLSKKVVRKIGAKMSKERLTLLQQAHNVLGQIISTVAPPAAGNTAGAPTIGKKKPAEEDTEKAKKKPDDEKKTTEKSFQDHMLAGLASLGESVNRLVGVTKSQQDRIDRIEKSRPAPSGGPVEHEHKVAKGAENVSWGFDINRPVTRETVDKNDGFFDDDKF